MPPFKPKPSNFNKYIDLAKSELAFSPPHVNHAAPVTYFVLYLLKPRQQKCDINLPKRAALFAGKHINQIRIMCIGRNHLLRTPKNSVAFKLVKYSSKRGLSFYPGVTMYLKDLVLRLESREFWSLFLGGLTASICTVLFQFSCFRVYPLSFSGNSSDNSKLM